jgi:hypothetical protein
MLLDAAVFGGTVSFIQSDCMLLDATVFGRFNVLFVNARPKTIPDGI